MEYLFDDIESIECIGQFENEYVYDIEVDDETHTFIGNDILVHNSLFITFYPAMLSCNWQGDELEFCKLVNEHRLKDYYIESLNRYAAKFGVENIQDFELEKILESVVFLEKKRYVQNIVYEDGIDHERLTYIFPKGVELIKSSTPLFVRNKLMELMKYILDTKHDLSISELTRKIKEVKNQFKLAEIEDISSGSSMGDYDKFVIQDQAAFECRLGTPFHVKAAAFHNYLLNNKPEYKNKYNLIRAGNKIKYYYCKDYRNEVFAFSRGSFPREIAPPIDIDTQFEKTFLNIINMFIESLGMPVLNSALTFRLSIFE